MACGVAWLEHQLYHLLEHQLYYVIGGTEHYGVITHINLTHCSPTTSSTTKIPTCHATPLPGVTLLPLRPPGMSRHANTPGYTPMMLNSEVNTWGQVATARAAGGGHVNARSVNHTAVCCSLCLFTRTHLVHNKVFVRFTHAHKQPQEDVVAIGSLVWRQQQCVTCTPSACS